MEECARDWLVVYGAGSQASVLDEIIRARGYQIAAVLNDWPPELGFSPSAPLIVGPDAVDRWLHENTELSFTVAIGNHHGRARVEKLRKLCGLGFEPASLIHPTSYIVADAKVGVGIQALAFSFVGVGAKLGDGVLLNTRASVDHECVLGDGVHIGPGATLAGRVTVGAHTFIGTGASVCPDVTIAPDCIIGAGSVVTRDIVEPGTYAGVPARLLKT